LGYAVSAVNGMLAISAPTTSTGGKKKTKIKKEYTD